MCMCVSVGEVVCMCVSVGEVVGNIKFVFVYSLLYWERKNKKLMIFNFKLMR